MTTSVFVLSPFDHINQFCHVFSELTGDSTQLGNSLDLSAEALRMAIRELGKVTGKVGVEDILDVVFKDFCIGK